MPAEREARAAMVRHAGRALAVVVAGLFMGLLAFGLMTQSDDTTIGDALAQAEPVTAPGVELDVLADGDVPRPLAPLVRRASSDRRVDLAELRGAPVVLNYWASWCIPCREEAALLQRAWERHGERGVLVLGLNMQDVQDDARGFLAEFGQTFPQIRDPTNDTARSWGVTGLPETFFLRRDGRIVAHVIGAISEQQLEQGIVAASTGTPMGAREGGDRRPTR